MQLPKPTLVKFYESFEVSKFVGVWRILNISNPRTSPFFAPHFLLIPSSPWLFHLPNILQTTKILK